MVIDTQFLASDARALIAAAEQSTGKPVVAAFVLHPNPDKFNGTATFQQHGARVLTSSSVLAEIEDVHAQRLAAFGDRYAPDFPIDPPRPDAFGSATTRLEVAGLAFELHVLGPGCGAAHVVVQWREHVFVGDLVASDAHAWMELAQLEPWLDRLAEVEAMHPIYVHPGRGPSGDVTLLAAQRGYLRDVAARVDRVVATAPTDRAAAQRELIAEIAQAYPDYRFAVFLEVAMPALWRRATVRARGAAG